MTAGALLVFTDGACSGNPGPGGWGAIVIGASRVRELGGSEPATTNNQMELAATIAALQLLAPHAGTTTVTLELRTDSKYVIEGITKWIAGWKARGWKTAAKAPVKNQAYWETLDALAAPWGTRLQWRYVRGHSGDHGNERCDAIAVAYSLGRTPALYDGERTRYRFGR